MKINSAGPMSEVNINLKKLMVIYGDNGSGKTYSAYSIYHLYNVINKKISAIQFNNFLRKKGAESDDLLSNKLIDDLIENSVFKIENPIYDNQSILLDRYHLCSITCNKKTINNLLSYAILESIVSELKYSSGHAIHKDIIVNYTPTLEDINFVINSTIHRNIANFTTDAFIENENLLVSWSNSKDDEDYIYSIFQPLYEKRTDLNIPIANLSERSIVTLCLESFCNVLKYTTASLFIPIERNGINSTFIEMELARTMTNVNMWGNYPTAIQDYYTYLVQQSFLDQVAERTKQSTKKFYGEELFGGEFVFDVELNRYQFISGEQRMDYIAAPSSAKTLFGLKEIFKSDPAYLTLYHRIGNIVIDEPETSLHPSKQLLFMKHIYELVQNNINVILITHSPYIVKDIINKIMQETEAGKISFLENTILYHFQKDTNQSMSTVTEVDVRDEDGLFRNFTDTEEMQNDEFFKFYDDFFHGENND